MQLTIKFSKNTFTLQYESNQNEISDWIGLAGLQLTHIGFILNTRWVASSYRTVHAVPTSHTTLVRLFERAMAGDGEARSPISKQQGDNS